VILILIVGIFLFKDSFFGDGENTGADQRPSEMVADGQQPGDQAPADEPADNQENQADNQQAEQQGTEESANQQEQPADNQASETREYSIKPGDTYGKIAAKELGDQARWKEIKKLNPDVNASALKVGQKIKLPAK
jgi:nucleoid-associated protein YgaU